MTVSGSTSGVSIRTVVLRVGINGMRLVISGVRVIGVGLIGTPVIFPNSPTVGV